MKIKNCSEHFQQKYLFGRFLHTSRKLWKAVKDRRKEGERREEGKRERRGRRAVPSHAGRSEPVPAEDQEQHPGKGQNKKEAAVRGLRPDPSWPFLQIRP